MKQNQGILSCDACYPHLLGTLVVSLFKSRRRLEVENLFLRHQLEPELFCRTALLASRMRSSNFQLNRIGLIRIMTISVPQLGHADEASASGGVSGAATYFPFAEATLNGHPRRVLVWCARKARMLCRASRSFFDEADQNGRAGRLLGPQAKA
jgi:hypothetical protein